MNPLLPLLRLGAALAALTLWWAPSAAQPASLEAQVSRDAPAPARAAPTGLAAIDACAAEAAPQVDDAPRAPGAGRPLRVSSAAPEAPRVTRPDAATRDRSRTARYRVARSGQAHPSAP